MLFARLTGVVLFFLQKPNLSVCLFSCQALYFVLFPFFHSVFPKGSRGVSLHVPLSLPYLSYIVVASEHIHSNLHQVDDWGILYLHEYISSGFHTDRETFHLKLFLSLKLRSLYVVDRFPSHYSCDNTVLLLCIYVVYLDCKVLEKPPCEGLFCLPCLELE